MINIDKDIPMPPIRKRTRAMKYPLAYMEVGDSFIVVETDPGRLRTSAYAWGRRHGVQFQAEDTGEGTRIWRVG